MKTCVIPNFLPKIALDIIAPPYSFISIDTPAGKSKRVIASTVFELVQEYRLSVYVYAFRIVHENLCLRVQNEEL